MPIEGCMDIEQVFDFVLGGNLNLMRNVIPRLWHFWKGKCNNDILKLLMMMGQPVDFLGKGKYCEIL